MRNEQTFQTIQEQIRLLYVGNEEIYTEKQQQRVNIIMESKNGEDCIQTFMKELNLTKEHARTTIYQMIKILKRTKINYEKEISEFLEFKKALKEYQLKNQNKISNKVQKDIEIICISDSRKEAAERLVKESRSSSIQSARSKICAFERQVMVREEKKSFEMFQQEALEFYQRNKKSLKENHRKKLENLSQLIQSKDYGECVNSFIKKLGLKNAASAKTNLHRIIERFEKTQETYEKTHLNFLQLQNNAKDFYLENKKTLTPTQICIIKIILTSKNRELCIKQIQNQTGITKDGIIAILFNLNNQKVNNKRHIEFLKLQKVLTLYFKNPDIPLTKSISLLELKRIKIILASKTREECISRFMSELGVTKESAQTLITEARSLIKEEDSSIVFRKRKIR